MSSLATIPHALALTLILFAASAAPAEEPKPEPARTAPTVAADCLTLDQLVHMSREELEALYCQSEPAPVLDGYYCGRAIRGAGGRCAVAMSKATGVLWKGKLFCAADCSIVNRWCLGLKAIEAQVYRGDSWLDGKPSLIMDYRQTSKVWGDVRDELRQVGPCLYLGIMYHDKKCDPKFAMFFALEGPHDGK
jgi:hypothetical protein